MQVTINDFAAWLNTQPLRGSTPATYVTRMRAIGRWAINAGVDLHTCTAQELVPLVAATPNTYSSRVLLKAVLSWWWRFDGRENPPVDVVIIPPKPVYRCRALSEDQAHRLASVAWGRHPEGTVVLVGLYMGLRISEIAAMEWTRFTGDGWYQCLGKGLKERVVPVADELAVHLRHVDRADPRWLFPSRPSAVQPHVHRSTVWKWVQRIASEAGVPPVAPHRMRHTFAATINDETGDFRTTQELMGHSDPKTTALYTRSTRQRMEAAVDVLHFLDLPAA